MLQVSSQTRRALSSPYICTSCLVRFADRPRAASSSSRKIRLEQSTKQARHKLWRETLAALKELQKNPSSPDPEASGKAQQSSKPDFKSSRSGHRAPSAKAHPARSKSGAIPPKGQRSIKAQLQAVVSLSQNMVEAIRDVVATQLDSAPPAELPERAKKGKQKEWRSAKVPGAGKKNAKDKGPGTLTAGAEAKNAESNEIVGKEQQTDRLSPASVLELYKGDEVPGDNVATTLDDDKSASSTEPGKKKKKKKKSEKKKGKAAERFTVQTINSAELELTPVEKNQPPVPGLQYGLDRVLFNPGVYHLQDPRSRVFNFDPYLAAIMPIQEFDFTALKQYVTSSKDNTLISIAAEHQKKYTGSTSSMGTMLTQFHYLLSSWRRINPAHVSHGFRPESYNFTRINRAPAATFLHWKNGTYAIDADKQYDTANILSMLGRSMEKLLTIPKDEFEKYHKDNSDQLTDDERNGPESFHYTTMGDFLMRSQLDAHDPRVLGTGMFDLKTRAVISIRMDARDFEKGLGYEIRGRFGQWESFEREYFDMIRSAFLKYSLQVRMGRMDGIFVAFHNTQRIFGFQYIPLPEMDVALHGTENTTLGDREFRLSLHLLNQALDRVTKKFPNRSLRLHIETRESDPPFMYIFAKPVDQEEIDEVQNAGKAQIEAFEQDFMGPRSNADAKDGDEARLAKVEEASDMSDVGIVKEQARGQDKEVEEKEEEEEAEEEEEEDEDAETSLETWEDMMDKVEDTLENDEQGVTSIREAIEDALEQSGLLRTEDPEESGKYLEALLEAVTSAARAPTDGKQASDGDNETGGRAEELDDESEQDLSEASTPGSATETVTDSNSSSTTSEMTEPSENDQNAESVSTDQDTTKDERASQETPSEEPSLKDLILRLAEQLKAAPAEHRFGAEARESQPDEDSPSDEKLHKFAVIMSEMMAKSRDLASEEGQKPASDDEMVADDTSSGDADRTTEAGEKEDVEVERSSLAEETESQPSEAIPKDSDEEEIYGMILTIKNKVNGKYVVRPVTLEEKDTWEVEYAFEDIGASRCAKLYERLLARRMSLMQKDDSADDTWYKMYQGKLHEYSSKGRAFREEENEKQRDQPVHVYGATQPLQWDSVFRKR